MTQRLNDIMNHLMTFQTTFVPFWFWFSFWLSFQLLESQSEFSLISKFSLQRISEAVKRYLSLKACCKVQKIIRFNIVNQGLIHRRWNDRLHSVSFHYFSKSFLISSFWAQTEQKSPWKFWILRIYSVFSIQYSFQSFCCDFPIFISSLSDLTIFFHLP
jgi:hypothetical protein